MDVTVELGRGAKLISQDPLMIPEGLLRRVLFTVRSEEADHLTSPYTIDPSVMLPDMEVINVHTGEAHLFSFFAMPYSSEEDIEVGAFYENPNTAMRYFVDAVEGSMITAVLIKSFQNGLLFQCRFRGRLKDFSYVEKIENEILLARLRKRMARFGAKP